MTGVDNLVHYEQGEQKFLIYNGQEYPIKNYVSRRDKDKMAYDILIGTMYIDEDTGLVLTVQYSDVITAMVLLAGYTDIEIPEAFDKQIDLYDDICEQMWKFSDGDYVLSAYSHMRNNFIKVTEMKSTLGYGIRKMLPELANSEAISETLGKGSEMTEFFMRLMDMANRSSGVVHNKNNISVFPNIGKRKI